MRIVTLILLVLAFTFMFTGFTRGSTWGSGTVSVYCYNGGQLVLQGRYKSARQFPTGWLLVDSLNNNTVATTECIAKY